MINRDYLPYPSAREYVDRGMAKWMGFFLSEHSTALAKEGKEQAGTRPKDRSKSMLKPAPDSHR
ncbi:MAG: hypothetical protein Q4A72_05020 [Bacillota bacterium]|nr:hypothetical protein [Bacillota bacterium]